MDGPRLDEDSFKSIARLPSRDVLDGQFAGVVASPLTGLVRGLGSMIQGLALQLGQIAEKGLVTGEAPAEAQPDEERPRRGGCARRGALEEPLPLRTTPRSPSEEASHEAAAPTEGDARRGVRAEEATRTTTSDD